MYEGPCCQRELRIDIHIAHALEEVRRAAKDRSNLPQWPAKRKQPVKQALTRCDCFFHLTVTFFI